MPVTNISLLRSYSAENPPVNPDPDEPAYIPFYSVLFYYKNTGEWTVDGNDANNGAIGVDYYRRYHISDPRSTGTTLNYVDSNGVKKTLDSFPLIKCVEADIEWKELLGDLDYPTTSMLPTAATLLENGGGHNPAAMQRTDIKAIPGFKTGDTQDPVKTYIDRTSPHGGHIHSVSGLYNKLLSTEYGGYSKAYSLPITNDTAIGFRCYEVETIIRDPKLAKKTEKLRYLPKNVLVFGDDLPTEHYTRTHPSVSNAANDPIAIGLDSYPLLAKFNPNFVGGRATIENLLVSNNSGGHTHSIATSVKKLSTVTGQTMYSFVDSGAHAHLVRYKYDVSLKSKKLKAWFTQSANTPLANGVILAYSIGRLSGYDGNISDSSALPPYWHFCDGDNETPDLRDYYIECNFSNNDHNVEVAPFNEITLLPLEVTPAGNHSHYSDTPSVQDGTPITVGAHGSEPSTTALIHTHGVSSATSFTLAGTATPVTNVRPGMTFDYAPPTSRLAFIMYNENIP